MKQVLAAAAFTAATVPTSASEIRRVVTGLDAQDRAVVLFDSEVPLPPGPAGIKGANLWVTDAFPLPSSKEETRSRPVGVSPLNNGTKFRVVEFPPLDEAAQAELPPDVLFKAVGSSFTPVRGRPPVHPFMHRTRSVDYAVVLSGEIDMMLDDVSVHLKPGDTIVQQATNHAWVNRSKEPARLLFVLIDAKEP